MKLPFSILGESHHRCSLTLKVTTRNHFSHLKLVHYGKIYQVYFHTFQIGLHLTWVYSGYQAFLRPANHTVSREIRWGDSLEIFSSSKKCFRATSFMYTFREPLPCTRNTQASY